MLEFVDTAAQAVSRITDGATVLIGGFGNAGQPMELIDALLESGATGLTVVNNNAGQADAGLALLIKERRVAKIICSFPRQSDSWHFDEAYRAGEIELELVPQGNLAERLRAGGAGIGGFFTPTGYGTQLAEGKEVREIDSNWNGDDSKKFVKEWDSDHKNKIEAAIKLLEDMADKVERNAKGQKSESAS